MPIAATCRDKKEVSKIDERKKVQERSCRERKVERCVMLLEHVGGCETGKPCAEGVGCLRTRQVLNHHRTCSGGRQCCICVQLRKLCAIHSHRCQNKRHDCKVPFCPNERNLISTSKQNLQSTISQNEETPSEEQNILKNSEREEKVKKVAQRLKDLRTAYLSSQILSGLIKAKSFNSSSCQDVQTQLDESLSKYSFGSILDFKEAEPKYFWKANVSVLTMKRK